MSRILQLTIDTQPFAIPAETQVRVPFTVELPPNTLGVPLEDTQVPGTPGIFRAPRPGVYVFSGVIESKDELPLRLGVKRETDSGLFIGQTEKTSAVSPVAMRLKPGELVAFWVYNPNISEAGIAELIEANYALIRYEGE